MFITTLPSLGLSDIGQYTAQVLFTDSITNKSTSQKITFVIINKIYIAMFVLFVVLVFVFLRFNSGLLKIVKLNNVFKINDPIGYKKFSKNRSSK